MIAPPVVLVDLFKPWNHLYSSNKLVVTLVTFLHTGGLLLAGGFAIAADRTTLRALARPAAERAHAMRELAAVHRWVITGLTVIVISGLLQLTSDIETFWGSWIFWTKMGLVACLLANGYGMTKLEKDLERDASETAPAWRALHRVSIASLVLWFTTAFAGIALENLA
jgi:hypothetical protein